MGFWWRLSCWSALGLLVIAACSNDAESPDEPAAGAGGSDFTEGGSGGSGTTLVKSAVARDAAQPNAEQSASAALAGFAWSVAEEIRDPTRDFVFSPYSIAVASAMLSAGAGGETLAGIQTALHFTAVGEPLHAAHNALAQALARRNHDGQVLKVSSDFWVAAHLSPGSEFLDTLARHYGAGVFLAPFESAADASRQAINQKVSEDTEGLIPALLPERSISAGTVFVLTNAVYLSARWAETFRVSQTAAGDFTLLDGSRVSARMMHGVLSAR
jgi:serpin B